MKDLLQRAEQSHAEQVASLQKKLEALAKEDYAQMEWLYEKGSKHLGVLAELIAYLKSGPTIIEDTEYRLSKSKYEHTSDIERMTLDKARESQPYLFDSQESVYLTAQPMRLMKDGTVQPINQTPVKISQ